VHRYQQPFADVLAPPERLRSDLFGGGADCLALLFRSPGPRSTGKAPFTRNREVSAPIVSTSHIG
jgi:hypothetical protein